MMKLLVWCLEQTVDELKCIIVYFLELNLYLSKTPLLPVESNRKAMNRNWSNQKANPTLKTRTGNK